jgi:hypothetical protein
MESGGLLRNYDPEWLADRDCVLVERFRIDGLLARSEVSSLQLVKCCSALAALLVPLLGLELGYNLARAGFVSMQRVSLTRSIL